MKVHYKKLPVNLNAENSKYYFSFTVKSYGSLKKIFPFLKIGNFPRNIQMFVWSSNHCRNLNIVSISSNKRKQGAF